MQTYLKSLPSRSIKYAPPSGSDFTLCLPQNIAHSIESGSFFKVSSVVLYIFPPTFNLIVLPTWTSESRVFDNFSEADLSGLRL